MSNELSKEYGFAAPATQESSRDLIAVEQSRAQHEVQAAYVVAKKFPRNEDDCFAKIINSCKRPFLAEQASYAFPKGGKLITGPSIRLAEVLAQCWGNIDFGIRELSQTVGMSVVEVYAIDLESNAQSRRTLHIPHVRDTKSGRQKLTDAREIYLEVANQSARRLRDCILKIIPGDVIEAAEERCKQTLQSSDVPIADQIRKMVIAFDELGVKVEHIEKRLGHKLDATIPTEIVTLKGIYKSLKDGMATREDFFDFGKNQPSAVAADRLDNLINTPKKAPEPEVVNQNTGEISPASGAPTFSFEDIKKGIQSAKSLDELSTAADLMGVIQDVSLQDELKVLYKKKLESLKK